MKRFFLVCLLLCLAVAPSLHAEETIWSGVIYATNENQPTPAPKELKTLSRKVERVFGYNQIRLVSQHRTPMKGAVDEKWLLPGKPFSLAVHSQPGNAGKGYALTLELFQDKRLLVKSGATLKKGCPVLIKGPLCAKGQLIIALAVE